MAPQIKSLAPKSKTHRPSHVPHVSKRPSKASTACFGCRRRKAKFYGGIPCVSCNRECAPCIMNEESDGRRKLSYKRRIASLEHDRALLMRLMESLRTHDQSEADRIVRAIRNGASLAEMDLVLTAGSGLCEPRRTLEFKVGNLDTRESESGTSGARQTYLDLNQLCV